MKIKKDKQTYTVSVRSIKEKPMSGKVVQSCRIKISLDVGAFMPTAKDGKFIDLYAPGNFTVQPPKVVTRVVYPCGEAPSVVGVSYGGGYEIVNTGVHITIPENYAGIIFPDKTLYFEHGITAGGLINAGDQRSVLIKVANFSADEYEIKEGERIAQVLIVPCMYAMPEIT